MRRPAVDLTTTVGSVVLPNPVLTASGTAGHGPELGDAVDLAALGAVVTKSLAPYPWSGNAPPRLHAVPAGMVNAVGLQGPGVAAWLTAPDRARVDPLRVGSRVAAFARTARSDRARAPR